MDNCSKEETIENSLKPSELGTIEYWNNVYQRERSNYEHYGDVGEIWFGEDSQIRILRWLRINVEESCRIIDLGCGNGMMLVELAREGYSDLTGVDYSSNGIALCKEILKSQGFNSIELRVVDLTEKVQELSEFHVALDKGTYDAISLNPDNELHKRKQYIKNISNILNSEGLFIITSCNWTETELIKHFESEFMHHHTIPTPSFSFGGKIGNIVSSVVFKKKR